MRHKYQGLPTDGYAAFTQNLLRGIPVVMGVDFLAVKPDVRARRRLIFTGPIDEFFDFAWGRLVYRGQQRQHEYLPNVNFAQPCCQINNPDQFNGPHIRTLEWKHLMPREFAERIRGTVLTREVTTTPLDTDHYEYPFPEDANANLYRRYRERAETVPNLLICGRLGEYRYYDMDQAIARALMLGNQLLADPGPGVTPRVTWKSFRRGALQHA